MNLVLLEKELGADGRLLEPSTEEHLWTLMKNFHLQMEVQVTFLLVCFVLNV